MEKVSGLSPLHFDVNPLVGVVLATGIAIGCLRLASSVMTCRRLSVGITPYRRAIFFSNIVYERNTQYTFLQALPEAVQDG